MQIDKEEIEKLVEEVVNMNKAKMIELHSIGVAISDTARIQAQLLGLVKVIAYITNEDPDDVSLVFNWLSEEVMLELISTMDIDEIRNQQAAARLLDGINFPSNGSNLQ